MPDWYPYIWYGVIFLIGVVSTFVGTWDYFNRNSGSRNIIWFDFLFVLLYFFYGMLLFEKGINTLVILLLGIVILSIQNIKFFIPIWRKPRSSGKWDFEITNLPISIIRCNCDKNETYILCQF